MYFWHICHYSAEPIHPFFSEYREIAEYHLIELLRYASLNDYSPYFPAIGKPGLYTV